MVNNHNIDFLQTMKKILKEQHPTIQTKDLDEAINNMLSKSNIKNFSEYIRTYLYRNENTEVCPYEKYKHLKYRYMHAGDLVGHSGQIERIAFDNSSNYFFTAGSDGIIKLWDCESGFAICSLIGHRCAINDLCFSKDGKLLVSCDFAGIINIWSLTEFKVLLTVQMQMGIAFAEFVEFINDKNVYNLVIILTNGIVKIIKFKENEIIKIIENDFTIDEPYKSICISDGGRFLLRAGYWHYLILIDTYKPEYCIVFETDGLPVKSICAAKDCLKFAAGCNNLLYQWTFFYEGNASLGNFYKTSKDIQGHWRKSLVTVATDENCTIENMCYLKNNYIVCVCSDLRIRIFAERILKYTICVDEMGILCPHPVDNIFAFCGQNLKIFYLDKLIISEPINFIINDCQFSNDGDSFVIGDEANNVRVYTLSLRKYKIKEQFFKTDFAQINLADEEIYRMCDTSSTVDSNREVNLEWKKMPYKVQGYNNIKNIKIENVGMSHLKTKYLDKDKYRNRYCEFTTEPNNITEDEEVLSSIDYSEFSEESLSSTEKEEIKEESKSSEEDVIIRRRNRYNQMFNLRSAPSHRDTSSPINVRLRRNDNGENAGLEYNHYKKGKRIQSDESSESSSEENINLVRKLRRNNKEPREEHKKGMTLRRHRSYQS